MENKHQPLMKIMIIAVGAAALALTFVVSGALRSYTAAVFLFNGVLYGRLFLVPERIKK